MTTINKLAIHKIEKLHESINWKAVANRHNQTVFEHEAQHTAITAKQRKAWAKIDKALQNEEGYTPQHKQTMLERLTDADWNSVELGLTIPKIKSPTDRSKCKGIILAMRAAAASGNNRLANSFHWVASKRSGFERIDRIGSLSNAIDKFQRLNPAVLKGGQTLKDAIIAQAWNAYAILENSGLDNASYSETQIPMDERRDIARNDDMQGFRNECYKASEVHAE